MSPEQIPPIFYGLGIFLLVGPLVTVHEFGHYLAGRIFGVHSEVFSFGFGRELLGITDRRGTRWRISAIPLGGYVRFAGDANAASMPSREAAAEQNPQALTSKPLWQRAIVAGAGPFINLLMAALIFAGFIYANGRFISPPVIYDVLSNSAAQVAGLQSGDRIVKVAGREIDDFLDIAPLVMLRNGQPTEFVIDRRGNRRVINVVPGTRLERDKFGNEYKIGFVGIRQIDSKIVHYSLPGALWQGVCQVGDVIVMQVDGIKQILLGRRPVSDLSGLPRMTKTAGEVMSQGWRSFLALLALVSVAIGAINLLPIPSLDGGHLLLYAIEGVARRPLNHRLLEAAYLSGFLIVLCLMIFTFWNDLQAMGAWSKLASLIS